MFWAAFFKKNTISSDLISPNAKSKGFLQTIFPPPGVLGESFNPFFSKPESKKSIPLSYGLSVVPRKQVFNLSCEFAAAATIIYHYTKNSEFSVINEREAEETLIENVGVSDNPNIGIRMGEKAPESNDSLYTNLNQKFGGENYYGIHAPPFIDLFARYKLLAKPVYQKDSVVADLQQSIYFGHLIMAWIKLGYNLPVDIALSYGSVPIVRGEHTVVIYGYDQSGVFVMDPGSGSKKHISYDNLLSASSFFTMPFLEVFPSLAAASGSYEPTFLNDRITGLNRSAITIYIANASKEYGGASVLGEVLWDLGYKVLGIEDQEKSEEEGLLLQMKKERSDYLRLLERDLSLATYKIASESSDLISSSSADVILTIRQNSLGN